MTFCHNASCDVGDCALSLALYQVLVAPAELIMISQQRSGHTMGQEVRAVFNAQGVKGFFRGWAPTLLRESGW